MNHHLDDQGSGGLDSDELALRRMLHRAVDEIEPSDGTLEHLRRAVPARRARKRQAAVGMAAAALFVGTAIPALVHVSNATGSDVNPSVAGHGSQAQGGASQGNHPDGGESTSGTTSGRTEDKGKGDKKVEDKGKSPGATAGATSGADPTASSPATAPACTTAELGSATANVDVPDSAGIVYGTFRVTNVSGTACTVGGQGTVSPLPQGAADGTKITVVQHASGDAAAALPDPSLYVSQLVLAPGSAYDVKFAWVPSETCPTDNGGGTDGGTGEPSPSPTPSENTDPTAGSTTGGDTGTSTQLMREDGTLDGSVVVSHTPEAGSPTVSATVSNACAGTIYRTGLLAGS
ncbi:hypothetical protein [Streptomyces griseus]|uniref:hypothetical protein n=1 Tax=Streptomyces griseus TaxID=1911 RepID=UPI0005666C59|nr:hypothetical protein [Streptomyces griseus]